MLSNSFQVVSGNSVEIKKLPGLFSQSDKNILYFYPRDNTPGCTLEARDFTCLQKEFNSLWIELIWVSQDGVESHKKFITDHLISFPLISDESLELHREFGAYGEKNNYGKIVQWVIRSTFLLDSKGNILKAWRNVKATGHAEKILKELQK
jgi:thioredoxin-dependent peroxiredoxin